MDSFEDTVLQKILMPLNSRILDSNIPSHSLDKSPFFNLFFLKVQLTFAMSNMRAMLIKKPAHLKLDVTNRNIIGLA